MTGPVHYRAQGFVLAERVAAEDAPRHFRAVAPGRVVLGHLVGWGVPSLIEPASGPAFYEWFDRGSLRLTNPYPPFFLRHELHGGTRIGRVIRIINTRAWCDVACSVDEGPAGDAVLDSLNHPDARPGDFPLSMAFEKVPGGTVTYPGVGGEPDGLCRTRAILKEVAIVDQAAHEGCYVWATTNMQGMHQMYSGTSR